MEKYKNSISKLKKHPIYVCIGVLFLICFFIFVQTHPLNKDNERTAREGLPVINAQTGTFTLITEPEQGTGPILEMIKNAKSSIDLVMYQLKDQQIADALIDAYLRGIAVRVLINQGYYGKQEKMNEPAYVYLTLHKIPVHWTPADFALTHQKTLIVDRNKALIMTFNLVPKYYPTGRDFGIIDTDQNDVEAIEKTFDSDWNNQKITPNNGDDLVWSPNGDRDMLLIINNAEKELNIYNEEMEDNVITNALIDAVKRGIDVNIIMTYQSSYKTAFGQLKNAGAHLHLFHGKKFYIHAKMIIADDAYAFIGSQNFSYTSLNKNRELGIFLSDPAILSSLIKTFSEDWNNARAF